jgi:ABC-type phosphate transport system substrate-binding protein
MNRRHFFRTACAVGLAPWALLHAPLARASGEILVIGHAGLPKVDAQTLQRLYTGRAIEIADQAVTVVNAPAGSALRNRFLTAFVQMDEERYRAYWTVRRHVGKGAPPRELDSNAEVIEFVARTPGGVGYIEAAAMRPGLNVIARG